MKTLYKAYPTGGFPPSLDNFCNTNMYITWTSDNYNGNEEIFTNAEVLILGNPIEIDIGKYIPNKYLGKIKTIGIIVAYYNETAKNFDYKIDTIIQGKITEITHKRLKKALLNQYYNYHTDKTFSWWIIPRKSLFIEVEKVNPGNKNILYKQKELHNISIAFDENGKVLDIGKNKRYFKLTQNIYYDTEKEVFIKNSKEILFSAYNSDIKKIFFKTLLENYPNKVAKETLLKALNITENKKLLDIKSSLLQFEFGKYLELGKDFVQKNILLATKGQGYQLIGEFSDTISK